MVLNTHLIDTLTTFSFSDIDTVFEGAWYMYVYMYIPLDCSPLHN